VCRSGRRRGRRRRGRRRPGRRARSDQEGQEGRGRRRTRRGRSEGRTEGRTKGREEGKEIGTDGIVLVVGLGNPGDRYTGTRHNVGFDVVQAFAEKAAGGPPRLDRLDCRALTGRVKVGDCPVIVARPQTYMNASGESVKGLAAKYDVAPERLIVVSDDTALPVGTLRLRRAGSSGGQKGLPSVIDCFGTNAIPRMRPRGG